tara:strand:- start:194 stop:406 length:213 start_codon:yes stop_codon:yes gene_type:complete
MTSANLVKQITEEVYNLKSSVFSVVRESTDDNYSKGYNSHVETDASEDNGSSPAMLEGEDTGTERKSATA